MHLSRLARATIGIGGLTGAIGVMAAAAAAHGAETRNFSAISAICLSHGPVLVALGLYGVRGRAFGVAAGLLVAGTAIFVLDLLARQQWGQGLFAMAPPLGGMLMIAGWLALSVGAIMARPER